MRWLATLLVLVLAVPAFAAAAKTGPLAKEGERLYKEGKYREAAESLKKAYEADPNPLYLFNIARAYDQAGDLQLSLDTYRQYISLTDTDPQLVKRANLAMDRLRALVAKGEADKQLQDAESKRLRDEAEASKRRAEEEAEKARELERQEQARRAAAKSGASVRMVAGIAIGVLALGGLGTGIGFGLTANGAKAAFRDEGASLADKKAAEAKTRQAALIADISYAAALALGITFAIVFPWSSLSGSGKGDVRVAFGPTGASLGGTF
ncbi:MAG: hypothetical protein IPJ65_30405 [Archangiaceae bacterium]|nr:hypothetical protein [Archangiaceae bacterium]